MNNPNRARRTDSLARRVIPAVTLIGASGGLLAALDRPGDEVDISSAGPPIATGTPVTPTTVVVPTTVGAVGAATTVPPAPQTVETTTVVVESTPVEQAPVECGATVLGPTVSTKFGPVQVQASVSPTGYVCSAQGVVWPTDDRKSVAINNQAIPLLDQWSAYQHDASFNVITGATYTSRAYKQSLQAVIDQVVAGG